jgi:putative phosphoesterase
MKIAIMSDSHDNWANLEKAIAIANEQACEYLLFAGDLIAPPGIAVLNKFNGKIKFVWGNNEAERVGITRKMDATEGKIEMCGDIYEDTLDGVRVFMNHYPKIGELAAKSGDYDLVIFGHTHEYQEDKVGPCLLLNPGEIQGYLSGVASFVLFDSHSKEIRKIVLS